MSTGCLSGVGCPSGPARPGGAGGRNQYFSNVIPHIIHCDEEGVVHTPGYKVHATYTEHASYLPAMGPDVERNNR